MPVKAKYIKDLPLKRVLDGSESLLVQDLNGTQQAPLEVIVDEIKQNSQEKIREIESELNQTNAQLSADKNELNARIDTFLSLPEGSTTADAELMDIRVGRNGIVYDCAGTAVRQQFLDVETRLDGGELLTVSKSGDFFAEFDNIAGDISITSPTAINAFSYTKNLAPFEVIAKSSNNITIDEVTDEYVILTIQPNSPWQNITLKSFYLQEGTYVFTRYVEYLKGEPVKNAFTVYMDYSEDGKEFTSDNRVAIPSTTNSTIPTQIKSGWRNVKIHIMADSFPVETQVKIHKFGCFKSDTNDYGEWEKYNGERLSGTNLTFKYVPNIKIYTDKQVTMSYQAKQAKSLSLEELREKAIETEIEIKTIKEDIDNISKNNEQPTELKTIVCWGDSLTNGTGNTSQKPSSDTNLDTSYPSVLSRLIKSDMNVINGGVGGETSWMIASRQGGMSIKIEPMTIPSNKVATRVYFKGMEQDYFYNSDAKKWTYLEDNLSYNIAVDGNALVNPCYINGVEGTLSRTKLSSGTPDPETGETVQGDVFAYYFTRSQAGNAVTFTTPKTLITNADKNYRNAINVIWMGQNDAPLHDGKYITQIGCEDRAKAMIDNLTHNKYIVMDLPSGDNIGSAERVQSFNQKFGKHYLNIREYICKYGIQVANELGANINLSDEDNTNLQKGQIPMCFKIDGVHGNYWYYQIVARAVYEKGIDLGYWI